MLYKVTSARVRPRQPDRFLHQPELRLSRADGDRRRYGQEAQAADRRADRRSDAQPRRQEPVGHPPPERLCHHRPPARALHQLQPGQDFPLWRDRLVDLDISPDGELLAASTSTVDGKQSLKVWRRSDVEAGQYRRPGRDPRSAPSRRPRISPSRPTARRCSAHPITPASRTSSASTSRAGKYEVLTNASTGFFRPQMRPDGSLLVYDYTGDGFNPSIVQPEVREDLGTVALPRHRGDQEEPRAQGLGRRLARQGRRSNR